MGIRGESIRGEACKQAANAISRCNSDHCAYCSLPLQDGDSIRYVVDAVWQRGRAKDVGANVYHEYCYRKQEGWQG